MSNSKGEPPPDYWKRKSLSEMTRREWELLCDRCGRCCLHKLKDEDTGEVCITVVACRYLDLERCRCAVYRDPYKRPASCRKLTPKTVRQIPWLPDTCAYRRIAEGKELDGWHPLLSGTPDTVHEAGISVRGQAVSESHVHPEDMERFVVPKDPEP